MRKKLRAGHRTGSGVVHNGAVLQQAFLEAIGAFANIMGETHQLSLCLRTERTCKRAAQRCGSLSDALPPSVGGHRLKYGRNIPT